MRSNSLGLTIDNKHHRNSSDVNDIIKPTIVTKTTVPLWLFLIMSFMWIMTIVVSGIVIWRVEHVHVHVAEIIAKVYECDDRPTNETVCTAVSLL